MKKLSFFLIICFILPFGIFAYDDWDDDPFGDADRSFGIKDRRFEMGFNANVNISNDFLSIGEIFSETLVLDLDNLTKGFNMNIGFGLVPFYFMYNAGTWGFGLSTDVSATGSLALAGDMLSLKQTDREKSEANAAVFASLGVDVFFPIQRFKVKIRPALFYALAFVKSELSYTFTERNDQTVVGLDYHIRVYSAFPFGDMNSEEIFTGSPGFDFSVGVEYPLAREIGLYQRIPFLDFDVGLDLINIPILGSRLVNQMYMSGRMGSDDALNSEFENTQNVNYDAGSETIERPFKMLVWADWRPILGFKVFTVTPTLGFTVNPLYLQPFSLEAGVKGGINLFNMFKASLGIGYSDRLWRNNIDLAFNVRAFELNFGLELPSPTFAGSWGANGLSGLGVNLGMKVGW
jgi:hypothetical protein